MRARSYALHILFPGLASCRRATAPLAAALAVGALLAGCGSEPTRQAADQSPTGAVPAIPATGTAARTYASDLTTGDGYTYRITVAVGPRSAAGAPDACPGTATPGRTYVPVTLTVVNAATDRTAPFPPVRVETTAGPGTSPGQVLVRDAGGACTFSPRVPPLGPGASAVFQGTSPVVDDAARGGSAGQVEVRVSESTFSLAAPLP